MFCVSFPVIKMSNSWLRTSQNSPGFLYFNTNKTPDASHTNSPDFIGFSNSPPPGRSNFSPQNYSSPQNFNRRFNSKPPPQKRWKQNRFSDKPYQNRSYNSNNSYNSSFNNSSPRNSSFSNKSKVNNLVAIAAPPRICNFWSSRHFSRRTVKMIILY